MPGEETLGWYLGAYLGWTLFISGAGAGIIYAINKARKQSKSAETQGAVRQN